MALPSALSSARKWAASGSLLVASAAWTVTALWLGILARHPVPLWTLWNVVAAAGLAAASVGIVRRSVLTQVLARGMALWVVTLALPPWSGSSWLGLRLFTAALSFAALRLAAPGLHTQGARAEFAPVAYRRVFLAGATSAVALGVSSAFGALWQAVAALHGFSSGVPGEIWGPALIALLCFAAAVGVLRMRAWGVLLGITTAAASLACALPVIRELGLLEVAYLCLPGVLLGTPLVASRLAKTKGATPRARVEEPAPLVARVEAPDEMSADEPLALAAGSRMVEGRAR